MVSDIFDHGHGHSHVGIFHGYPVVAVSARGRHGLATGVKRALDVCVSALVLVLLTPLAGVIMLAIKLPSPGPVCFEQERLGLHKDRFRLYKFRTMVAGAEAMQGELERLNEADGPVFKVRNDPRMTRVGRWLRKATLDELSQFLNVLKGDISLVRPRPLPVRDDQGFSEDWHRRRFSVRPGMTCLWQVSGRSNTSFQRWMALHMQYIDTCSLALDIVILAKTIPAVFGRSGEPENRQAVDANYQQ